MSIKDKMMESMMDKMSKEEKLAMMDTMMDKFFDDFTPEDKQKMMGQMMPKMMGGGMNMMGMMKGMMSGMMGRMSDGSTAETAEEGEDCCGDVAFNPMEMCRSMMTSIGKSHEMAEFATPELRGLFQDWVQQIEEEILAYVNTEKGDSKKIAEHFKLSEESVIYILGKLAQKGKINFKPEKV